MPTRKYFCTFPQALISEPIISHTLGEKFPVIPNIRAASITDAVALVAVEDLPGVVMERLEVGSKGRPLACLTNLVTILPGVLPEPGVVHKPAEENLH